MVRILGADPGSRIMGFGLIACPGSPSPAINTYQVIDAGVIKAKSSARATDRVAAIHLQFYELLKVLAPDFLFIESAFFGLNPQSALRLGEARGALISAAAHYRIPVSEVSPTSVKKTITGNGHADKAAVANCVKLLLNMPAQQLPADVTDALGIALSGAISLSQNNLKRFNSHAKSMAPGESEDFVK